MDGTLKSDEGETNTFNDFSRKAQKKGTRDISVIYAFDVDLGEPVCSKPYGGNVIDVSTLEDFIQTNDVDRGVIVTDKGFSYSAAKKAFLDHPDLHFLIPLKRDSAIIGEYRMYDHDSSLPEYPGMTCRKARTQLGTFLYSFHDPYRAKKEEEVWVGEHSEFDPADLSELRKQFGTITFISDVEMTCLQVYRAYEQRWELEVMFRFYKNILELDETRVHDDMSIIGTEFVNFLSILMTYRLKKAFFKTEAFREKPYKYVLKRLRRATMIRGSDGEYSLRKITDKEFDALKELGVVPTIVDVKNPVGRPRKKAA